MADIQVMIIVGHVEGRRAARGSDVAMRGNGAPVLLLLYLLQSCVRGGRRRVEDMCYERRRAEACVDESAHHALVNAGTPPA